MILGLPEPANVTPLRVLPSGATSLVTSGPLSERTVTARPTAVIETASSYVPG